MQSLLVLQPLQSFVYNDLCGTPAWPFGSNDPLALEPEPGKPKTYFQSLAAEEEPTPWNVAEIGDILTFAFGFETAQLINLLLRLGWLDDLKQGSGKALNLSAHTSMFTFMMATTSVCGELEEKRVFNDNVLIGKVIVADIDEADLSVFIGLQITLFDAVSTDKFAHRTQEGLTVLPGYRMILSVATFSSMSSYSSAFEHQHAHLTERVPEELTRFIWMNFGSVPFDERLMGSCVTAWGIEPCTELTLGDSPYLTDHHPNDMPFWDYMTCAHDLFYSKGVLAQWVRNVLRWHRLEFARVQSLLHFPHQLSHDFMASSNTSENEEPWKDERAQTR